MLIGHDQEKLRYGNGNWEGAGPAKRCRICDSVNCLPVATLPFGIPEGEIQSVITKCGDCGCYWRSFEPGTDLNQHFEVQSYTSPDYEDYFRRMRQEFFRSLATWSLAHLKGRPELPKVLDVGCSYGHLLEIFLSMGFEGVGIEPVAWLRNRLNESGSFRVYGDIRDLPAEEGQFDVIALVDSLYYVENPLQALRELVKRLAPGGNMIIRVTNRTPLLNFRRKYFGLTNRVFGDQIIAFSHKGMLTAFRASELKMKSFCFFERKPIIGRGLAGLMYYRVLPAIAAITRLKFTPGLTYLCAHE